VDYGSECPRSLFQSDAACGQAIRSDRYPKRMRGYCTKCGARRIDSQIGLEPTPEVYVVRLVEVFREARQIRAIRLQNGNRNNWATSLTGRKGMNDKTE
jgi:hypothetical protein